MLHPHLLSLPYKFLWSSRSISWIVLFSSKTLYIKLWNLSDECHNNNDTYHVWCSPRFLDPQNWLIRPLFFWNYILSPCLTWISLVSFQYEMYQNLAATNLFRNCLVYKFKKFINCKLGSLYLTCIDVFYYLLNFLTYFLVFIMPLHTLIMRQFFIKSTVIILGKSRLRITQTFYILE